MKYRSNPQPIGACLVCLGLLFGMPYGSEASSPETPRYTIHNLAREFYTGWQACESQNYPAWETYWFDFLASHEALYASIYGEDVVAHWKSRRDTQLFQQLQQQYNTLSELQVRALQTQEALLAQLDPVFSVLDDSLHITRPLDIYILAGVCHFNGKEFLYRGEPMMAFDVHFPNFGDVLVQQIAILHEGAHVLHLRRSDPDIATDPIGMFLLEGLAVYTTKRLMPGFPDEVYTFHSPEQLVQYDEQESVLLREILAYQTHARLMEKYFFGAGEECYLWPRRAGYYTGLRLVEQFAETYALDELFRLPLNVAKPRILKMLQRRLQETMDRQVSQEEHSSDMSTQRELVEYENRRL